MRTTAKRPMLPQVKRVSAEEVAAKRRKHGGANQVGRVAAASLSQEWIDALLDEPVGCPRCLSDETEIGIADMRQGDPAPPLRFHEMLCRACGEVWQHTTNVHIAMLREKGLDA